MSNVNPPVRTPQNLFPRNTNVKCAQYNITPNPVPTAANANSPMSNVIPTQVPPATELDCIEVPKVFDEALIQQCISYIQGADPTNPIGSDSLRQTFTLTAGDEITGVSACYGFQLTGINIVQAPGPMTDYKFVSPTFNIVFYLDVNSTDGTTPTTTTLTFTVPRTINNIALYCPEQPALIYTQQGGTITDHNQDTKKIVMVPNCMGTTATIDAAGLVTVDVRLGFNMLIKCEHEVQLQVLSTGYCPTPEPYGFPSPCDEFFETNPPDFYPPNKVE